MRILIIGTGYVGLVTGTCFSEMGNEVTCIDIDEKKINNLRKGVLPLYEPGLEQLIKKNVKSNRLHFSTSLDKSINNNEVCFIAVGTPQGKDGDANMDYVYNVAHEIGDKLYNNIIVVNKSTVPVGTSDKVRKIISTELKKRKIKLKFSVVSNPEFLKEGDAIRDFMNPDRIIIGSKNEESIKFMKNLYAPFNMKSNRMLLMGNKEAELTKYAANSMLATKISFINEISLICDKLGIDVEDVRNGIGSDKKPYIEKILIVEKISFIEIYSLYLRKIYK